MNNMNNHSSPARAQDRSQQTGQTQPAPPRNSTSHPGVQQHQQAPSATLYDSALPPQQLPPHLNPNHWASHLQPVPESQPATIDPRELTLPPSTQANQLFAFEQSHDQNDQQANQQVDPSNGTGIHYLPAQGTYFDSLPTQAGQVRDGPAQEIDDFIHQGFEDVGPVVTIGESTFTPREIEEFLQFHQSINTNEEAGQAVMQQNDVSQRSYGQYNDSLREGQRDPGQGTSGNGYGYGGRAHQIGLPQTAYGYHPLNPHQPMPGGDFFSELHEPCQNESPLSLDPSSQAEDARDQRARRPQQRRRGSERRICSTANCNKTAEDNLDTCSRCTAKVLRSTAPLPTFEYIPNMTLQDARDILFPPKAYMLDDLVHHASLREIWIHRFIVALARPAVDVDDERVPQTEKNRQGNFNGKAFIGSGKGGQYSKEFINASVCLLFEQVIYFHHGGVPQFSITGSNAGYGPADNALEFEQRLEAIEHLIWTNKLVAEDVIGGKGVGALVANPDTYGRRKKSNSKGNEKKSKAVSDVETRAEAATTRNTEAAAAADSAATEDGEGQEDPEAQEDADDAPGAQPGVGSILSTVSKRRRRRRSSDEEEPRKRQREL